MVDKIISLSIDVELLAKIDLERKLVKRSPFIEGILKERYKAVEPVETQCAEVEEKPTDDA